MSDPMTLAAMGCFALAGLAMLLFAGLRAWNGWLDLKRLELGGAATAEKATGGMAELIEMADLRERVRKLESIASYVDL
jgi:hypothetical protein